MELSKEEQEAIKEFRKIYENDLRKYDDFNTYMQFIIERNGIILNLISKLQKENEKQSKVIDEMAEKINQAYFDENNMWIWFEENIVPKNKDGEYDLKDLGTRKNRIKQYFYRKVEEDVDN